jgi:hypothetical protein
MERSDRRISIQQQGKLEILRCAQDDEFFVIIYAMYGARSSSPFFYVLQRTCLEIEFELVILRDDVVVLKR